MTEHFRGPTCSACPSIRHAFLDSKREYIESSLVGCIERPRQHFHVALSLLIRSGLLLARASSLLPSDYNTHPQAYWFDQQSPLQERIVEKTTKK